MCLEIIRKESVLALFSGLSASVLRQLTYSTVRFGGYERMKNWCLSRGYDFTMGMAVLAGAISGGNHKLGIHFVRLQLYLGIITWLFTKA
jgi:hypothetical protein